MRNFPVALGQAIESVDHLRGPSHDDAERFGAHARPADPERWRASAFVLPLGGAASGVWLRYRADTRQIWSIRVDEATGLVPFCLGEVDLRNDLRGVVAALGPAEYEAQVAPILREHHWRRGDVSYVATAFTARDTLEDRVVGFLRSLEVWSVSLGPADDERRRREAHLRCCFARTDLPVADFAASLGRLLALPTTELGRTFNLASATLRKHDGAPAMTIIDHRPCVDLLELEVEGAAKEEALALGREVRRHAATLGSLV